MDDANPLDSINAVTNIVGTVFSRMLTHNCDLLRGSIVVGDMVINDRIILGPALIQAHYLEENVCVYPRLVLDSSFLEYLPGFVAKQRNFKEFAFADTDGVICLNYLKNISQEYLRVAIVNKIPYFENLCACTKDLRASAKIGWATNYIVSYLYENGMLPKTASGHAVEPR